MGCTFQETTDLGPVCSSSPLNVHVHDHDCIGIELRILQSFFIYQDHYSYLLVHLYPSQQ